MKAIVKASNVVTITIFWNDKVPQEGVHQVCVAVISIDTAMKMENKNYLQVYSKECKYHIKKKKMTRFIDIELHLDDSDDSE